MLGLPAARVDSASVPTSCVSFVTRGAPSATDGAGQKVCKNLVGYPLPNSAAPLGRGPAAPYRAHEGQALVGRPEGSPLA